MNWCTKNKTKKTGIVRDIKPIILTYIFFWLFIHKYKHKEEGTICKFEFCAYIKQELEQIGWKKCKFLYITFCYVFISIIRGSLKVNLLDKLHII